MNPAVGGRRRPSALFTPLHLLINPPAGLPVAFVLGFVFVALRAATGSLWLPIGFHTGYNGH